MIQHCRKALHSRTKENRLVIQIQKALWRKLEPLKEVKENALASEGKSCRPENNNYSQSICISWPLSVKHAAKITFAQYKCRTFQSIIYPADKNNFIGISSILAWGKSRVGLPPPFIALIVYNKGHQKSGETTREICCSEGEFCALRFPIRQCSYFSYVVYC